MKTVIELLKRELFKMNNETPIDGYLAVIRSYFYDKNYRIKEYNGAYDSYFGFKEPGWIFCTKFITKFRADIFMIFKHKEPYRRIYYKRCKLL